MKKVTLFIILFIFTFSINAADKTLWSNAYQNQLMDKIGEKIRAFSTYPSIEYPNRDTPQVLKKFPDGKVLLFGYGSLLNATSASRSVSLEAVQSMRPVIAFGLKRIFNYKAMNVTRWGSDLEENERAMLNIEPTTTFNHIINGVVMEINPEDLGLLVERERGYDLVPILVADWNKVLSEDPSVNIEIAYTFFVPDELRDGIDYTQTKYYPVRGYLQAVREGAEVFGPEFLDYWNATTYLGDGTTSVSEWNEETFSGILDTKEP
jgi:hypothetical protein